MGSGYDTVLGGLHIRALDRALDRGVDHAGDTLPARALAPTYPSAVD